MMKKYLDESTYSEVEKVDKLIGHYRLVREYPPYCDLDTGDRLK